MPETSANGTVFECHGDPNNPAIALIHGLGLTRETWRDFIPRLSQDYHVINYDLFGHGQSAPPPQRPSVTLFSEQLNDLLDELGIARARVVGFSLGGMINRRFAMDHPERAMGLVILNSPHDRGEEAQKLVEQRAADTSAGGPGATLDATIERWFTPQFREQKPDVIEEIRHWVLANDPDTYAQCRMVLAHGVKELIRPEPPITHPSLVITCENDTGSTPKMSHDIATEIQDAKTIIIPSLQHMGLMERSDLFVEPMLEFLSAIKNP